MHVKKYILTGLALLTGWSVFADVRNDTLLNEGWWFKKGEVKAAETGVTQPAGWEKISVPHNWGFAEAQQGNKKYYRGPGWYRRALNLKPKDGKRYFLRFEAVGLVSDVYLNGKLLGQHRGGFSAFCYEITGQLNASGANLLAVRADNKKYNDVAPLGGDFNQYGGIYRSVHLIEAPELCFALTDHASSGVTWLQTKVSKKEAVLDVTALISNGTTNGLPFTHFPPELGEVIPDGLYTLAAKLIDQTGKTVVTAEKQINVTANKLAPYDLQVVLKKPHHWNGTLDPYLYRAVVELKSEGQLVDSVEQRIGLRSFHVDPAKGFFLNGAPYRIRGVAKHQDRKDKGWAVSDADLEEDMALIKEMGANAIRTAHYQHSDYFYRLCDEAGMLVYPEIPQVGGIHPAPDYNQTTRNQQLDLIRQNINHCSIFCWGLFNEVHVSNDDPHRLLMDQKNLYHGEDPTRPTMAATSHAHSHSMNRIPDLLGWNRYPGWYDPLSDLHDLDLWDKYAPTSRHGGFCFSEYGAGANIAHHEQQPEQPVPSGFWHPEEWQAMVHEAHWACFSRKPYVWGTFIWNMFDFSACRRREGGKAGINDKGLVTFDRKVKKDAFYFYKANWSEEPTLHLTSKRHAVRREAVTPVKVYGNCGKVTLTVNGHKIGTVKPDAFHVARWDRVTLKRGQNEMVVTAKDQRDEAIWIFDPTAASLKPGTEKAKRIGGDGGFGH